MAHSSNAFSSDSTLRLQSIEQTYVLTLQRPCALLHALQTCLPVAVGNFLKDVTDLRLENGHCNALWPSLSLSFVVNAQPSWRDQRHLAVQKEGNTDVFSSQFARHCLGEMLVQPVFNPQKLGPICSASQERLTISDLYTFIHILKNRNFSIRLAWDCVCTLENQITDFLLPVTSMGFYVTSHKNHRFIYLLSTWRTIQTSNAKKVDSKSL